ncbi:MAG: polymerase [Firmicutes bacterium]|nr:polymerase [Bacillota bacterium]
MPLKFILIDGSSLVHRAFYALPLLTTAAGQYTNAVYGFTTMLIKIIQNYKPDRIAVAFDKSRKTFRTDIYPEYKAQRKPTPNELSEQFQLTQEVLGAFGIAVIEIAGFEADDIIGTLACRAEENDCEVNIVTGDRDALQLISPSIKVLLTRKGITDVELMDQQAMVNKYGVQAKQLIDIKGLMGDVSDNIPGVPGVGEKTAIKLINEFGSVEAVLENIDKISGKKLQQNLREYSELALLSKKLATIECNMPLEFVVDNFVITPDLEKVHTLLTNFEFKSLLTKIDSLFNEISVSASPELAVIPATCTVLEGAGEINEFVTKMRCVGSVAVNFAVSGSADNTIIGVAMAVHGQAAYIPAGTPAWNGILEILADKNVAKLIYNVKVVYELCAAQAVSLAGVVFDPLIAAYLLDPTAAEYQATLLSTKYLNKPVGWQDKDCSDNNPVLVVWFAQTIAELYLVMPGLLNAAGLDRLYNDIEFPLTEVLAVMETTGIKVDGDMLRVMSQNIADKVEVLLKDIYQLAEEQFNVNSTKQLGVILFDKLKLPVIKKTKTGYSTDAEVLEKLAGEHPLIDKLLEYRMLTKLKSTYLDGISQLISAKTGRLHTSFNQTVTATGRLSSSEPNLQNIPVRTDIGRKIRELFVPGEGFAYLMSADYSQIELRVLAHMAGDEVLLGAFRDNKDIHKTTASEVFGVPESEVTGEMRSRAKAVNFGIVYGISDYGLSRDIGVSRKEAGRYIDSYFDRYPAVKAYIDRMVADARQDGYVTTLFGRRRYLPEIHSSNFNQRSFAERTAMNTPIQGTAADIIKKAMLDVYRRLISEGLKSRIILQVHDELVLEVAEDEKEKVAILVKSAMEEAVNLAVPLTTEVKIGVNWAQAK